MYMKQLIILLLLAHVSQAQPSSYRVAICEDKRGCEEVAITLTNAKVNELLGKPGLLNITSEATILLLNNCSFSVSDTLSMQQLHTRFGGKGVVVKRK